MCTNRTEDSSGTIETSQMETPQVYAMIERLRPIKEALTQDEDTLQGAIEDFFKNGLSIEEAMTLLLCSDQHDYYANTAQTVIDEISKKETLQMKALRLVNIVMIDYPV